MKRRIVVGEPLPTSGEFDEEFLVNAPPPTPGRDARVLFDVWRNRRAIVYQSRKHELFVDLVNIIFPCHADSHLRKAAVWWMRDRTPIPIIARRLRLDIYRAESLVRRACWAVREWADKSGMVEILLDGGSFLTEDEEWEKEIREIIRG